MYEKYNTQGVSKQSGKVLENGTFTIMYVAMTQWFNMTSYIILLICIAS